MDAILGVVIASAATYDLSRRTYLTYKLNRGTQVYYGRTSGYGTPNQILRRRLYSHRFAAAGVTSWKVDRAIQSYPIGYWAIRGREQQLIDAAGGIGAPNLANLVRGVSKYNLNGPLYHFTSDVAFGNIAPYTGNIHYDISKYFR